MRDGKQTNEFLGQLIDHSSPHAHTGCSKCMIRHNAIVEHHVHAVYVISALYSLLYYS